MVTKWSEAEAVVVNAMIAAHGRFFLDLIDDAEAMGKEPVPVRLTKHVTLESEDGTWVCVCGRDEDARRTHATITFLSGPIVLAGTPQGHYHVGCGFRVRTSAGLEGVINVYDLQHLKLKHAPGAFSWSARRTETDHG